MRDSSAEKDKSIEVVENEVQRGITPKTSRNILSGNKSTKQTYNMKKNDSNIEGFITNLTDFNENPLLRYELQNDEST